MTLSLKRRYFSQLAPGWASLPVPVDARTKMARFVRSALRPGARRILDVGCGTGALLPWLLETHPGADCFVELDFSEEMLMENPRKIAEARVVRVCADAQALPFGAECFDLVLCFGVLPHLGDMRSALGQQLRVLRPGGVFSVGHLMGSSELNAFHRTLGGPIADDMLLPAQELAKMLAELGAAQIHAEESADWYFVRAEKEPA